MTGKRTKAFDRLAAADVDLRHALERLKQGQPQNPELKLLQSKGLLRITISSVAKEANRSRTLIGMDTCKYREIRSEVLAAMTVQPRDRNARSARESPQQKIAALLQENTQLRHDCALFATRVMDAVNVARSLERKLDSERRKSERVASVKIAPKQIVSHKNSDGNVVRFHRDEEL